MIEATDLSALLTHLAARYEARMALLDEQRSVDFRALDAAASRWAVKLRRMGCGTGSRIGLLAANRVDWLEIAFGVWRAGATLVPLSTFGTERELAELVAHAEMDRLIVGPNPGSRDLLRTVVDGGAPIDRRRIIALGDGSLPDGVRRADDDVMADPSAAVVKIDPEQAACLLYTSGTTGRAKGVLLSHRAILATVGPTAERSGLSDSDVMLSTLPLFWVAGLVIRALPTLACGSALALLESFSPASALAALRRWQPTALHLRPPQVGQILAAPEFSPELLGRVRRGNGRTAWYAGALPAEARLITGYGMTEMAGYVTALDWRDGEDARRDGIGHPLPGVELRIVDDAGQPVAPGLVGHVQVRGPGMFSGYFKEEAAPGRDTARRPEAWFDTGDLGSIDAAGAFRFVGRDKDLLRVKGINVSPVEVETVLATHPGVEAVYVVGIAAAAGEQDVVAVVVPRDAARPPGEEELRTIATRELSAYKRPRHYLIFDRAEIPLGGTSKPQRDPLSRMAEERLRQAARLADDRRRG